MKNKNSKYQLGGALLFAVVTAFLLSFISASIIVFTSNQYRIIDEQIKRKESYYWMRAGMEYAICRIRNGLNIPCEIVLPEKNSVKIMVNNDTTGISDYKITVTM